MLNPSRLERLLGSRFNARLALFLKTQRVYTVVSGLLQETVLRDA